METTKKKEKHHNLFSRKPIYIWAVGIVVFLWVAFTAIGIYQTTEEMKQITESTMTAAETQIEYRIQESINLLEALANEERFYNPELPYMDKVIALESINEEFGYMMIRYVDSDINVCSQKGLTSLASRDYMQKMFTTGEIQVTDSFLAGADGTTLNYTVAVPMYQNGEIVGGLFCAIYFDEVQQLLDSSVRQDGLEVIIIGSQNQIMSATDTLHYGDSYIDYLGDKNLLGINRNQLETDLFAKDAGSFWAKEGANLFYTTFESIEDTGWSILATSDFLDLFFGQLLVILPSFLVCIGILVFSILLLNRYLKIQQRLTDETMGCRHNVEQIVSLNENPKEADLQRIIRLTGDGLVDSLTGVVTRVVFINKIPEYFNSVDKNTVSALCFVDMDDLKTINDTYGHDAGDAALKSIGYILREYEKKYDGLVCRYGGDEFILFVTGMKDIEDLRRVMGELCSRLAINLGEYAPGVVIGCSIGVAVYKEGATPEQLITEADGMLYQVKHNGKGGFKINMDGE